MARLEGIRDDEAGVVQRAVFRAARRRAGQVPEPLRIMARSAGVMWAAGGFELGLGRARAVDPALKDLASLKVASLVGCVF